MFKIDFTWEILLITPNLYFTDTTLLLNLYCTNVPNVIKSCHSKLSFSQNQNIKRFSTFRRFSILTKFHHLIGWNPSFTRWRPPTPYLQNVKDWEKIVYRKSYQMKFSCQYFWFHVCSEKSSIRRNFHKKYWFWKIMIKAGNEKGDLSVLSGPSIPEYEPVFVQVQG